MCLNSPASVLFMNQAKHQNADETGYSNKEENEEADRQTNSQSNIGCKVRIKPLTMGLASIYIYM